MHYWDKFYWSNVLLPHVSMRVHHLQGAIVALVVTQQATSAP
jgi:hypothetical protein